MTIHTVFGGGAIAAYPNLSTPEQIKELFDLLISIGLTDIDTARLYPGSEAAIGLQPSRTSFTISTKHEAGFGGASKPTKENIIKDTQESYDRVNIPSFDILYLHRADTETPWEEQIEGINEAYKKGIFKRFGLSNFTAEQVEEVHKLAKEKGYVLPTVYQGNYNPVARHLESLLFPTLRKLGIAFYAYSPLAGGFLTKTAADLDAGAGRFNATALGGMYKDMYDRPALRAVLEQWGKIAEKEGVSKAELAYRWVASESPLSKENGDAIIIGGSKLEQIEQTVAGLKKGGLSKEAKEGIDQIWLSVKDTAPVDNTKY